MYASFIFLFHIMGPRLSSYHCFSLAHYFLFVTSSSWIFCKKTIEIMEQEYFWLHAFWKVTGWRDGKSIFEIKVKLEYPRMANVCPDMFGAACRGEFVTINPYSCGHWNLTIGSEISRKWHFILLLQHWTCETHRQMNQKSHLLPPILIIGKNVRWGYRYLLAVEIKGATWPTMTNS